MTRIIATLTILAIMACSPESILTPEDCKVEKVKRAETWTIGETVTTEATYRVTMADGRQFDITEAEALKAQADPVAACQELRERE